MSKNELVVQQIIQEKGYLKLAKLIAKLCKNKYLANDEKEQRVAAILQQLDQKQEVEQSITIEHSIDALQSYIMETVTPQNMTVGTTVYDVDSLYGVFSQNSTFTIGYDEVSWLNENATLREVNTNKHLVNQYRINVLDNKNIVWRNEAPFQVEDQEAYALPISSLVPDSFTTEYRQRKVIKGNVLEDIQKEVNVYLNHDREFIGDVFARTRSK